MQSRIRSFFLVFIYWVVVFVLQKPLFMLCHLKAMQPTSLPDWLNVALHGLPLDLSVAGYLTAIPGLLLIASVCVEQQWIRKAAKGYFALAALLVAVIFVLNVALYGYWGFPLDSTPLFYFLSSPKDAMASVSWWIVLAGVAIVALLSYLIYKGGLWAFGRHKSMLRGRLKTALVMLLLTALLFLPIRGSVTVSSMNTGKAYFSERQPLNHAAVNPALSLLESLTHDNDFASQYRFMTAEEADSLMKPLIYTQSDSTQKILKTDRPDVYVVILESFSSQLMATLGGQKDVAVCLDRIASEGILFTNFYANSFRTDRGLVSILSGYPAQPTTSLMKYPRKTKSLPSLARSLSQAGYATTYYYGGDADFTNMRSYLVNQGYQQIISDADFPMQDRLSKWGVNDGTLFERVMRDLKRTDAEKKGGEKSFIVIQTSSSHEPFDVPYSRLSNKILNAFAYTDSCAGAFIDRLKATPRWANALVLLVPDHLGAYPEGISNAVPARFQIPLILTGGAIKGACRISTIGSQQDIAATLLGQLQLPHDDFTFSKDLLDSRSPHFAFFTMPDEFGFFTANGQVIYDNKSQKTIWKRGQETDKNLRNGKAYLQKLYDDISKR